MAAMAAAVICPRITVCMALDRPHMPPTITTGVATRIKSMHSVLSSGKRLFSRRRSFLSPNAV